MLSELKWKWKARRYRRSLTRKDHFSVTPATERNLGYLMTRAKDVSL